MSGRRPTRHAGDPSRTAGDRIATRTAPRAAALQIALSAAGGAVAEGGRVPVVLIFERAGKLAIQLRVERGGSGAGGH